MKVRFFTTLGILALIIPALLLGGVLLDVLIGIIIVAGAIELLSLSDHHNQEWSKYTKVVMMILVVILIVVPQKYAIPLFGIFMLCILSIPVFTDNFTAKDAFIYITYLIFFYMLGSAFLLIYGRNPKYIWLIIFATYACDTFAYFTGYFFGKHKLNTRISPKKTIEGAIGGWFFGALFAFAFGYFFVQSLTITEVGIVSIILPITAQIGDLSFSAIKRSYNIKDFSNLLPGHGGILDRLDSLIFNIICFYFILVVIIL
ncbi:MAG: phosphatidate cytidylyltransferase [Erysipelotrichaceae bacterium]